jgi:hypothetical protein
MQTRLDKLLSDIRPERTIVETFNRANEAINTFRIDTAQIEEWDEFKHCMAEFMRHVDQSILKLRRSVDASSEYYWSHLAQPVLCAVYGSNGQKAAFEMARTGNPLVIGHLRNTEPEELSRRETDNKSGAPTNLKQPTSHESSGASNMRDDDQSLREEA